MFDSSDESLDGYHFGTSPFVSKLFDSNNKGGNHSKNKPKRRSLKNSSQKTTALKKNNEESLGDLDSDESVDLRHIIAKLKKGSNGIDKNITEKAKKRLLTGEIQTNRENNCKNYYEHVTAIIDSYLEQVKFSDEVVNGIASQMGYIYEYLNIPNTIMWAYVVNANGKQIIEYQKEILLIMSGEKFFENLDKEDKINNEIKLLQQTMPDNNIILLISNFELNLKKCAAQNSRTSKKRVTSKNSNELLRIKIENLFVDLQLDYNVNVFTVNTPKDMENFIHHFSKSIAVRPEKLETQNKLVDGDNWLVNCDTKASIRVDKSGNGLSQLWLHQLMQFSTCNLDIAQAIVNQYPTPISLFLAYENCGSIKEKLELLKDIIVQRGIGVSAVTRKVGRELSKKICLFLISDDGSLKFE